MFSIICEGNDFLGALLTSKFFYARKHTRANASTHIHIHTYNLYKIYLYTQIYLVFLALFACAYAKPRFFSSFIFTSLVCVLVNDLFRSVQ